MKENNMATALEIYQRKAQDLEKSLKKKYDSNKALARQLIAGAKQNADYQISKDEPLEKWYITYLEELKDRL